MALGAALIASFTASRRTNPVLHILDIDHRSEIYRRRQR